MALGIGRILIQGLFQLPPKLAAYDIAHSLPLGNIGRDFPFTEDGTRRHISYLSGTFRESCFTRRHNCAILCILVSLYWPSGQHASGLFLDTFHFGIIIGGLGVWVGLAP